MSEAFVKTIILLLALQISACGFFEEPFNEKALKVKESAEKNSKDYEIKFIAEIAGYSHFIIYDKNDKTGMGNNIKMEKKTSNTPHCTEIYVKSKDVEYIIGMTLDCISGEKKKVSLP